MRTLIIQSCSETQRQSWMRSCLDSVESWARARSHDYHLVSDEIFKVVPAWYLDKVRDKLPVATDYARLALLRRALGEGYEQAVWLDADVVVFDAELALDFSGTCAFGQEYWVQERDGRLEVRRNVHNAVCVFRRDCPVLPFLLHTVESLIRRVEPERIAPQMAGPKLLNALHPLCDFALLPQVGALSPLALRDICRGEGEALELLRKHSTVAPRAMNVCASLAKDEEAALAVTTLLLRGRL